MHIRFTTDNPETTRPPLISRVLRELSLTHATRLLDVAALPGDEAIVQKRSIRWPISTC